MKETIQGGVSRQIETAHLFARLHERLIDDLAYGIVFARRLINAFERERSQFGFDEKVLRVDVIARKEVGQLDVPVQPILRLSEMQRG